MPKEIPEWEKQLMEKEPEEETMILDAEILAPYKEKIKTLESELGILDNFLRFHFDAKTKPQRYDFVDTFGDLNVIALSNIDSAATALSNDLLEGILVYMANRLQNSPLILLEISNELQNKEMSKPLKQIFEYVKTLHLGIVENKKKILWQLAEYIGIKKSAAIFQEQDDMKERLFPEFVARLNQKDKQWLESGEPKAIQTIRQNFNFWYEENKEKFGLDREKIHGKVDKLSKELDDKTAYEVIEKHLSTNPQEIFELFESQTRISSG